MHTFTHPRSTCTPSTKCPSAQWARSYRTVTPTLASRLLAVMLRTLTRLAQRPAFQPCRDLWGWEAALFSELPGLPDKPVGWTEDPFLS